MTFAAHQIAALEAPLDRAAVATRQQSGRSLSYVEGWHCISEANRIFGFGNWHRETVEMRLASERERAVGQGQGFGVSYISKVRVTVFAGDHAGIIREGYGTGHGIDRDLGLAHESACKEAETDAMKRALMTFGNPFGLALYDKTQAHVAEVPPPPVKPKMTADDWVDDQSKRLDAMAKKADIAGIQAWPAAEAKALAKLKDTNPQAHAKALRVHANALSAIRAAG